MTPADLQNSAMKRIAEILKDFPLATGYNDLSPFKVYKQSIPEQTVDQYDYSDGQDAEKAIYPFVMVKLSSGEKKESSGEQQNYLQFVIGVKNEDLNGKGFDDALAAMQAIQMDIEQNPLIDKRFSLDYPITWATADENTHPYYFIGMETTWNSQTMTNLGGFPNGY
ncbi:hypothetical protein [Sporosarcina sp. P33]|uniref:hypothetical protein n=1 Tax=Sporosarcina sp. P33 TaxID=1930764 RepID=UPI0009BE8352|nr:hypothetical protein [Sporosarcina sp. P33]ARD47577.1 hypothetical protein SporoP33_04540 [Sporosarcina sp. P33]